MNKQSSGLENSQHDDPLSPARVLSSDALARRRLLLKSASGGAAALAALTPVRALAGSTVVVYTRSDGKKALATMSGVQSATHSFGPNVTQVEACGKKVAWWGASSNNCASPTNAWPSACTYTTPLSTKFPACNQSWSAQQMLWVANKRAASDDAHAICAYLNALKYYPSAQFPYSPQQVLDLCNGKVTGVSRSAAIAFFTTYLENLA